MDWKHVLDDFGFSHYYYDEAPPDDEEKFAYFCRVYDRVVPDYCVPQAEHLIFLFDQIDLADCAADLPYQVEDDGVGVGLYDVERFKYQCMGDFDGPCAFLAQFTELCLAGYLSVDDAADADDFCHLEGTPDFCQAEAAVLMGLDQRYLAPCLNEVLGESGDNSRYLFLERFKYECQDHYGENPVDPEYQNGPCDLLEMFETRCLANVHDDLDLDEQCEDYVWATDDALSASLTGDDGGELIECVGMADVALGIEDDFISVCEPFMSPAAARDIRAFRNRCAFHLARLPTSAPTTTPKPTTTGEKEDGDDDGRAVSGPCHMLEGYVAECEELLKDGTVCANQGLNDDEITNLDNTEFFCTTEVPLVLAVGPANIEYCANQFDNELHWDSLLAFKDACTLTTPGPTPAGHDAFSDPCAGAAAFAAACLDSAAVPTIDDDDNAQFDRMCEAVASNDKDSDCNEQALYVLSPRLPRSTLAQCAAEESGVLTPEAYGEVIRFKNQCPPFFFFPTGPCHLLREFAYECLDKRPEEADHHYHFCAQTGAPQFCLDMGAAVLEMPTEYVTECKWAGDEYFTVARYWHECHTTLFPPTPAPSTVRGPCGLLDAFNSECLQDSDAIVEGGFDPSVTGGARDVALEDICEYLLFQDGEDFGSTDDGAVCWFMGQSVLSLPTHNVFACGTLISDAARGSINAIRQQCRLTAALRPTPKPTFSPAPTAVAVGGPCELLTEYANRCLPLFAERDAGTVCDWLHEDGENLLLYSEIGLYCVTMASTVLTLPAPNFDFCGDRMDGDDWQALSELRGECKDWTAASFSDSNADGHDGADTAVASVASSIGAVLFLLAAGAAWYYRRLYKNEVAYASLHKGGERPETVAGYREAVLEEEHHASSSSSSSAHFGLESQGRRRPSCGSIERPPSPSPVMNILQGSADQADTWAQIKANAANGSEASPANGGGSGSGSGSGSGDVTPSRSQRALSGGGGGGGGFLTADDGSKRDESPPMATVNFLNTREDVTGVWGQSSPGRNLPTASLVESRLASRCQSRTETPTRNGSHSRSRNSPLPLRLSGGSSGDSPPSFIQDI